MERQHHCWDGRSVDLVYPIRLSGDTLVLERPPKSCSVRDEGEAVLTSHPLKRVR